MISFVLCPDCRILGCTMVLSWIWTLWLFQIVTFREHKGATVDMTRLNIAFSSTLRARRLYGGHSTFMLYNIVDSKNYYCAIKDIIPCRFINLSALVSTKHYHGHRSFTLGVATYDWVLWWRWIRCAFWWSLLTYCMFLVEFCWVWLT